MPGEEEEGGLRLGDGGEQEEEEEAGVCQEGERGHPAYAGSIEMRREGGLLEGLIPTEPRRDCLRDRASVVCM